MIDSTIHEALCTYSYISFLGHVTILQRLDYLRSNTLQDYIELRVILYTLKGPGTEKNI